MAVLICYNGQQKSQMKNSSIYNIYIYIYIYINICMVGKDFYLYTCVEAR